MYVRGSNDKADGHDRFIVNNRDGQIIFRRDGKKTQDYYYANGQQLGTAGSLESLNGNFDSGFSSVSEMQRSSPGTYTVQSGDTLQGIARKLWGDASLWYMLADANGISSNEGLGVGVSLSVPTVNNNVHNNSETFKPYDASKIIGKSEAEPIAPPAPSGCGMMIVAIVVIVVATIVTAGAGAAIVVRSTPSPRAPPRPSRPPLSAPGCSPA